MDDKLLTHIVRRWWRERDKQWLCECCVRRDAGGGEEGEEGEVENQTLAELGPNIRG